MLLLQRTTQAYLRAVTEIPNLDSSFVDSAEDCRRVWRPTDVLNSFGG